MLRVRFCVVLVCVWSCSSDEPNDVNVSAGGAGATQTLGEDLPASTSSESGDSLNTDPSGMSSDAGDQESGDDSESAGNGEEDSGDEDDGLPRLDVPTPEEGNEQDLDGDKIPNEDDPFPEDGARPGVGEPRHIFMHSSSKLYTLNTETFELESVGDFTFDESAGQVTDIALDRFGVLYAVTFSNLFVCSALDAQCWWLAGLPEQFNGLTMIPPGVLSEDDDTLVAIANSGKWFRVDFDSLDADNKATLTEIGSYGGGQTNSGDVYSIEGVGTFGAVDSPMGDKIVRCDPSNGMVEEEITTLMGRGSVWGLAGSENTIFAFERSEILAIDPETGDHEVIDADSGEQWWGAGVRTMLPPVE